MKEMSVDNLDIIAQGGMGKIYRINDEQILKVFNDISLNASQINRSDSEAGKAICTDYQKNIF